MGSFEVRSPSHFPATLLKSVTAVGCHLRVSLGAMELQPTMTCTAMIMVTIFKILRSFIISSSFSIVASDLQLIFNRQNANEVENQPVPHVGFRVFVVLNFFPIILSGP